MSKKAVPGFSLIEIVIAIALGLAITIAAGYGVKQMRERGRIGTTKTTLKALKSAIDFYHEDTGAYPSDLQDLVERPADEKVAKKWQGAYLDKILNDGWNNPFEYSVNAKGSRPPYELYSWGANGAGSPEEEWISVWNLD